MNPPQLQRYHLFLYAEDSSQDVLTPMFAADDDQMLRIVLGHFAEFVALYPAGELRTEAGELLWRKGTLDA